jgi:hypothetical protein
MVAVRIYGSQFYTTYSGQVSLELDLEDSAHGSRYKWGTHNTRGTVMIISCTWHQHARFCSARMFLCAVMVHVHKIVSGHTRQTEKSSFKHPKPFIVFFVLNHEPMAFQLYLMYLTTSHLSARSISRQFFMWVYELLRGKIASDVESR